MVDHAYFIVLYPLVAAFLIFFFGRWLPMRGAWVGIGAVLAGFLHSGDLLLRFFDKTLAVPLEMRWPWFSVGIYEFEVGIWLDGLSLLMLLVVTLVSLLVQIYSLGYMRESPRFKRFYAYLALFTFAMLILVIANNFLQFFVGWELVGVCSYLLIGFEFEREAAAAAGNKAFLTTQLGDLGFYAGILLLFVNIGTLNFNQMQIHLQEGFLAPTTAMAVALLLFCGAIGKSAQFPLHVWLPDAMEGPTPVSALIHAATMVAAGVYMVARLYGLFAADPRALEVVAWVGAVTALFAATLALVAEDMKRVLAFSTVSQLGYMMLGLGVGGLTAGMFHLTTHAAFKALLFLGAGSVIHAVHTNDIWKMGGLAKRMITTASTFLMGALALAGVIPFAGYYSKDAVLSAALASGHTVIFGMGVFAAFLTAFYVTRLCALVFMGDPRDPERFSRAHESPWSMTLPLMILAALSFIIGKLMLVDHAVSHLLHREGVPDMVELPVVSLVASGSALGGMVFAWMIYVSRWISCDRLAARFRPLHTLLAHRCWMDEVYELILLSPVRALSRVLAWVDTRLLDQMGVDGVGWAAQKLSLVKNWLDQHVVDFMVDFCGSVAMGAGGLLRRVQSGFVQDYLFVITFGFILMMFLKVFW